MKKFEYILKNTPININSSSYLEDYLRGLGIKKPQSFINAPQAIDEEQAILLENIDEITKELKDAFDNDLKFFLQVDSDADGYTSAAIFYNYFKKLYPKAKITYRLHKEKEHGIIVDTVPLDTDVVIIPDAGSNQFDEQRALANKGMKVLVIDHHHVDNFEKIKNVVVVNNQLSPRFRNKDLSGAGMVFKVIQYFSKLYSDGEDYKDFTDLAALGIIGDMMDTRNLDNNFIIYHGLRNIKSKIFEAMLYLQDYSITSVSNPNKIDIAFYITPLINGVIRAGTAEDKMLLFESFIDNTRSREVYEREYHGRTLRENYYEMVARTASNIKDRQNTTKENTMEFIDKKLQEDEQLDNSILFAITSRDDDFVVPKTMTGLVAMELVKKYGKPTLVVRPKKINGENFLFGSGRASTAEGFNSFRDVLNESEYTHFAQGHDNAFGFGIKEDYVPYLIEELNYKLKDIDFENDIIEVDYIFKNSDIHHSVLNDFAKCMPLYGNGIVQPKFAFELFLTKKDFQVMGSEKNVLKMNYKNIDFIQFRANDTIEEINKNKDLLKVTIIGRSQINEFRGQKKLQVVIDNIRVESAELKELI